MSMLPYFYDMGRPLRLMEQDFFRPDLFYSPLARRDFLDPFKHWDSFAPWNEIMRPMEQLSKQISQLSMNELGSITADDEKFQINVDVQHFSPEEISVKVIEGQVIVEGKHEEKQDQHGYVSRQFVRKYALPHGCLPDTVQSKLSSDGVLTVIAPKVLPLPSTGEKIIPITQTGPIRKQLNTEPQLKKVDEAVEEVK